MKTISRDGKKQRAKGGAAVVHDDRGRERAVPDLSQIPLRYKWNRFSSHMEFYYEWRGQCVLVHAVLSRVLLDKNQCERVLHHAAIEFCKHEYGLARTEKDKDMQHRTQVRTVYSRWLKQMMSYWGMTFAQADLEMQVNTVMGI